MPERADTSSLVVHPLQTTDLVAMAQCVAIDAGAFPYPSITFEPRSAWSSVLVARDLREARVLGFLSSRARRGPDLYIEGLATRASARRCGIGRALLRAAIQSARVCGVETLSLHVWTGNRAALDLYSSEDFDVVRHVLHFYRPLAFATDDAYQMVRVID